MSAKELQKVAALSIELIESNNESVREQTYKLIYSIVDRFPLAAFIGKGLPPIAELQLTGFYGAPGPLNSRRQTTPPTSR